MSARLGRIGGGWGPAQRLFASGAPRLMAIGTDGTAAVVWHTESDESASRTKMMLAIAPPGEMFQRARVIASGTELSGPAGLVARPDGRVVAVWGRTLDPREGEPNELEYALSGASRPLLRGQLAESNTAYPSVSETTAGAVVVAYRTPLAFPIKPQAAVQVMPAGAATFGAPESFDYSHPDDSGEAYDTKAVSGPGGTDVLVGFSAEQLGLEIQSIEPDGGFGPKRRLLSTSAPGKFQLEESESEEPNALAADGALVRGWTETRFKNHSERPLPDENVTASVTPAGATGVAPGERLYGSRVARGPSPPLVASFGTATIAVWVEDAFARGCGVRIFYAYRPAGASFGGRVAASAPLLAGPRDCVTDEAALSAGGGDALAAWERRGVIVGRLFSSTAP